MNEALKSAQVSLPVTFESGLTLLGYAVDRPLLKPGETVYLETVWRVDRVPTRPLSIMAHVVELNGRAVAVGDGLGVPVENWQPGDLFVQRHALSLPKDAPRGSYWARTGVYWLDNGRRWTVRDARTSSDRVLLMTFQARR